MRVSNNRTSSEKKGFVNRWRSKGGDPVGRDPVEDVAESPEEVERIREDRRLVYAGIPVFLIFSLFFARLYFHEFGSLLVPFTSKPMEQSVRRDDVFPVLLEQKYAPKAKSHQIRALSDVTAEGTGALTKTSGFHTLTQYDALTFGPSGPETTGNIPTSVPSVAPVSPDASDREGEGAKKSRQQQGTPSQSSSRSSISGGGSPVPGSDDRFRIPANYRFQQDFSLRYDEGMRLSIAREKMAGFRYFQSMLRQIRDTFSPPGINYAYRDAAGYVVNQPIKPQAVQVLFSIDDQGYVRDVKVVASMGQQAVDEACVNTLANQNFGTPPPEIFAKGHIFGINFIFPPVWNR